MASDEYFRELSYIVEKGAVNVVQDYFKLLDSVETLMSMSKMNVQQISEAAGISEWQLYRRKNKPELWTKDELIKLFSHLEVKAERTLAQQPNEKDKTQEGITTPFLGPRADGKTVSSFRTEKISLSDRGYPVKDSRTMVKAYLDPIKDKLMKEIDRNTLLITVPSGSGENKIPILFAKQLARETGATLLPEGIISKLHKGEAKLNLSLEKRVHDPIRYTLSNPQELKKIASQYQRVIVVDDLINSGESSVRLRKTLEQNNIKVHAFANLVNVENRYPSKADLDRVFKKISEAAQLTLSDKLKLKSDLTVVFADYTKQKLNYIERSVKDLGSALTAFHTISKAAALENKLKRSRNQNLSL